jgi:hypothetical protein
LRSNIDKLSPNKRIIKYNNLLEDRSILLDWNIDIISIKASIVELDSFYLLQIDFLEANCILYIQTEDIKATKGGIRELSLFYFL